MIQAKVKNIYLTIFQQIVGLKIDRQAHQYWYLRGLLILLPSLVLYFILHRNWITIFLTLMSLTFLEIGLWYDLYPKYLRISATTFYKISRYLVGFILFFISQEQVSTQMSDLMKLEPSYFGSTFVFLSAVKFFTNFLFLIFTAALLYPSYFLTWYYLRGMWRVFTNSIREKTNLESDFKYLFKRFGTQISRAIAIVAIGSFGFFVYLADGFFQKFGYPELIRFAEFRDTTQECKNVQTNEKVRYLGDQRIAIVNKIGTPIFTIRDCIK